MALQYTAWPRDNDAALDAFFGGRPDGSAKWEVSNLVYIPIPWRAFLAGTNTELKRGIRVNKKVAESLARILASLWETFGKDQAAIEKVDLHQIGGTYFFRARRGSSRVSNHARGIAIDIDPADNPMRKGAKFDMDPRIVAAFEAEGWRWGAAFNDPMHFEAIYTPKKHAVLPVPKPVQQDWAPTGVKQPSAPKTPPAPSPVNLGAMVAAALPGVKRWEAFRATIYWDVKQPAIGYGHNATGLPKDTVWTEAQASGALAEELTALGKQILAVVKVPITVNQGAALISFAYNLGFLALAKSTLLRKLNAKDASVAGEFGKWVKAGGKTLKGLVDRRESERLLFLQP